MHFCVCEDNDMQKDHFISLLRKYAPDSEEHYYSAFADPAELLRHLENAKVDILLMDVVLGEENGIEWVGKISDKYPDIAVIYITGHSRFHFPVYRTRHCCFLEKPIDEQQFAEAVGMAAAAVHRFRAEPLKHLWVTVNGTTEKLHLRDIVYIERKGRVALIHCKDGRCIQIYTALHKIMENLDVNFERCHSGYIVNFAHVKQKTGQRSFLMTNGHVVDIAQLRHRKAVDRYLEYIGNRHID